MLSRKLGGTVELWRRDEVSGDEHVATITVAKVGRHQVHLALDIDDDIRVQGLKGTGELPARDRNDFNR